MGEEIFSNLKCWLRGVKMFKIEYLGEIKKGN